MTYSQIVATAAMMRSGNDDVLTPEKYTDTILTALNYTAALAEMKLDLQSALSLDYDDTTTLDEVADMYSLRLGRALGYKQLAIYYQKNDTGADTKNRVRWEMYRKLYEAEKQGFGSLKSTSNVSTITSVPFKR